MGRLTGKKTRAAYILIIFSSLIHSNCIHFIQCKLVNDYSFQMQLKQQAKLICCGHRCLLPSHLITNSVPIELKNEQKMAKGKGQQFSPSRFPAIMKTRLCCSYLYWQLGFPVFASVYKAFRKEGLYLYMFSMKYFDD